VKLTRDRLWLGMIPALVGVAVLGLVAQLLMPRRAEPLEFRD